MLLVELMREDNGSGMGHAGINNEGGNMFDGLEVSGKSIFLPHPQSLS